MKLLSFVKSFVSRRELSLSDTSGWRDAGLSSESGLPVTETRALALSTAWACINLIAGTTGSLPLEVRVRQAGGHTVLDKSHPLYRVLHDHPNADQTALDFWEYQAASLELQGDGMAHVIREGERVIALVPLRAKSVSRQRVKDGHIRYRWQDGPKSFDVFDDEILHIRGFGGSPLGGISTLRAARNTLGLASAADATASAMFANGMKPGGVLKYKEFLTPENRDLINNRVASRFVGAQNSGKPLVLEGDADWMPLSINPDEAQMLESRRFSVEEICRFFGVPPHMVGHTEKSSSWGKGLEQQTLAFVTYTLRRRLKRIEKAIEQQLLTPADRAKGVSIKFNLEGLLRGDSSGRAKFYREMTQIGAMTINEVRRKEGLPPVEGGDVPRMQMQNVPITEAQNDV